MNTGQGITALDPTVGLLRKELEVNSVPPGQEAQYFQSKGRPLNPQLVFLIQANQELQQHGQMGQARPPQGTVADDLSAALVQKANAGLGSLNRQGPPQMPPQGPPQMPPQGPPQMPPQGPPQMPPQGPPQMDPRQQGIAQLPQEAVGNGMAAGGIVAFDDGGSVRHFAGGGWTAAEQEEFDKLRKLQLAGVDPYYGSEFGVFNFPEVSAAQNQKAERYKELLTKKQAAEQAAKEQAQAAKVSGVLSQYGLDAPAAAPAAAAATAPQGNANFNMIQEAMKRNAAPAPAPAPTPPRAPDSFAPRPPAAPVKSEYEKYLASQFGLTPDQEFANIADDNMRSGLDAATAARNAAISRRKKEIEDLSEKDAKDKKQDMLWQLAAAGFGSVGKGRTFAQGVGNIGANVAQGMADVNKQYRGLEQDRKRSLNTLEDAQIAMQEADAARMRGDLTTARNKKLEAAKLGMQAENDAAKLKIEERANQLRELGLRNDNAYRIAALEATSGKLPAQQLTGMERSLADEYKSLTTQLQTEMDPTKRANIENRLKFLRQNLDTVRKAQAGASGVPDLENLFNSPSAAPTVKWGALK